MYIHDIGSQTLLRFEEYCVYTFLKVNEMCVLDWIFKKN